MSGSMLAYHLRQNKAIERNLFIELLRRIGLARNISDYQYIGFGGPFLEDYKLIHNALRILDMHSIEREENTHIRQRFNRPVNFIQLHHCDAEVFFRDLLNTEKNSIVWLDYADPSELTSQFNEFLDVASKLGENDVLKITLNANSATLGFQDSPQNERPELRLGKLIDRLGDYVPPTIKSQDMTNAAYPTTLQACLRYASNTLSSRTGNLTFRILSSFQYKDGPHTMLTVMGVMLPASASAFRDFLRLTRIKYWDFKNLDWSAPLEISVPNLSIKERLLVEEALPLPKRTRKPAKKLQQKLGFWPCSEYDSKLLENYAKFYRAFPYFSKVNPT